MLLPYPHDDSVASVNLHRPAREPVDVQGVDPIGWSSTVGPQYPFGNIVVQRCAFGSTYSDALANNLQRGLANGLVVEDS